MLCDRFSKQQQQLSLRPTTKWAKFYNRFLCFYLNNNHLLWICEEKIKYLSLIWRRRRRIRLRTHPLKGEGESGRRPRQGLTHYFSKGKIYWHHFEVTDLFELCLFTNLIKLNDNYCAHCTRSDTVTLPRLVRNINYAWTTKPCQFIWLFDQLKLVF